MTKQQQQQQPRAQPQSNNKPICRIIDLDDPKGPSEVSIQMDLALREHGFFYIKNHGIPSRLIQDQFDISHQIFDLPLSEKQSMPFDPVLDIGYLGSGLQAVGLTKQQLQQENNNDDGERDVVDSASGKSKSSSSIDIKEQFMMTNNRLIRTVTDASTTDPNMPLDATGSPGQREGQQQRRKPVLIRGSGNCSCTASVDNVPDDSSHKNSNGKKNAVFDGSLNYVCDGIGVPNHLQVASEYASAIYELNSRLQMYLATALLLTPTQREQLAIGRPDDDDENSDSGIGGAADAPPFFMVLKQMKYQAAFPSDPSLGRYGAGPHTDWGSFTILATDSTPGLQVFLQSDDGSDEGGDGKSIGGRWVDVPPVNDCLIVNSGDQISCLTNGRYKSALHRVMILPEYVNRPRYSTACFCYFAMESTFRPLPQFATTTVDNEDDQGNYDPSQGRTTREYFHYKLHQSVSVG